MKLSKTLLLTGVFFSALTSCGTSNKLDVTYNAIYADFTKLINESGLYDTRRTIVFLNRKKAIYTEYSLYNSEIQSIEKNEYAIKYNSQYIILTESIDRVDIDRLGAIVPGKDFIVFVGNSEVYTIIPQSVISDHI